MCGRYTLRAGGGEIAHVFGLDPEIVPDLPPRFNVAPTQPVPAVRRAEGAGARELALLRWGLVPGWADDPDDWPLLVNARSETAREKPAFRDAFRLRRCLIPADGFYEWVKVDGRRHPFFVRHPDDRLFAFAGLWERREAEGGTMESCTVLTTRPNDTVAKYDDRMPVILPPDARDRWLDPAAAPAELEGLLEPLPDGELVAHLVDRRVNDAGYDAPDCVRPLTG